MDIFCDSVNYPKRVGIFPDRDPCLKGGMVMEITEVKVRLWDDKRLRALVTIVFEDCFVVRNIKVIEGRDGKLFVAMPSRRMPDGTYSDIAHPITKDFRGQLEATILSAFIEERDLAEQRPSLRESNHDGYEAENRVESGYPRR